MTAGGHVGCALDDTPSLPEAASLSAFALLSDTAAGRTPLTHTFLDPETHEMDEPRSIRREPEIRRLEDQDGCAAWTPEALSSVARLMAMGLGIIAIVIGLYCSAKVFFGIHDVLTNPEGFQAIYQQWVEAVGGEELSVQIDDDQFPVANLVAILVLGLGSLALAWIAIGIMITGARIVSWTSSDREAIKKILRHTFGSGGAPKRGASASGT